MSPDGCMKASKRRIQRSGGEVVSFIHVRSDDRSILKYFLPYGYMRRFLAREYGFVVEDGDFSKRRITVADVSGFHIADVLPLCVVMSLQRRRLRARQKDASIQGLQSVCRELAAVKAEFYDTKIRLEKEVERLSVENMRLEMQFKSLASLPSQTHRVTPSSPPSPASYTTK